MKWHLLMAIFGVSLLSFCGRAYAQAPVPGQPYQIPDGYTGTPTGSLISYGGYNYVIQDNSTMLLATPATRRAA
jgi:hypothetical protein